MEQLTLIESGEVVGYVDPETLEVEYNGESDLAERVLSRLTEKINVGMEEDDLYGEPAHVVGDRAVEYVENMTDIEEIPVEIKERE